LSYAGGYQFKKNCTVLTVLSDYKAVAVECQLFFELFLKKTSLA